MSSTNTIGSAAGNVHIENMGASSGTYQLIEVSDISYKFDINDITKDTIGRVHFMVGSCSITVLQKEDTGVTTFEQSVLLATGNDLDLVIGSYTFPMRFNPGKYTVDDMRGTVTFKASGQASDQTNIATFSDVWDNGIGATSPVTPAGQMIKSGLNDFRETSYVIISGHFGELTMPSAGNPDIWGATSERYTVMRKCASLEGAYFGTGFNKGFYVQRSDVSNKVTLTQDNIISVERNINFPDLKSVSIQFSNDASGFTGGADFFVNDSDTVNPAFRQELVIVEDAELVRVTWDDTDLRLEGADTIASDTAALAVTSDGIGIYEDILRGTAPFVINIRVEGFDTIKPWQPFDITDTTGKLSLLTERTYRPLELSYSLNNTIQITAYAIV